MNGPLQLSHTHEAIARFMVMNPTMSRQDVAKEFGYSPSYVSILVNSDAFQEKLRELGNAADGIVIQDIPARLRGVAGAALEKLQDMVDEALTSGTGGIRDREFILETADKVLHRLGYAPKRDAGPTVAVQNNAVIVADRDAVNAAVQKAMGRFTPDAVPALPSPVEASGERQSDPA